MSRPEDDLLELDLTRTALARPVLELDLESHRQQVELTDVVGFVDSGVQLPPAPISLIAAVQRKHPIHSEQNPTVHPELVEGLSASTSSARTDVALPSVAEFAVVKLAEELGYTEVLTVGALEDGIRFYQQRTAESCLEMGKRLLLLKELSGHGEFIKRAELLGINERTARRFMSATRKFTKTDKMSVLIPRAGNQSKLLELLVLDDGDLQEIADGGEAGGITLDEIECMTATELRKALRKHKDGGLPEDLAAKVEAEKKPLEEKIQSLEKQIDNHEKHYGELQAKHEVATHTITKLTASKNPANAFSLQTMAIREEAYALEYGARVYIDALTAKFTDCLNNPDPKEADNEARFNAIGVAVGAIYAGIEALHEQMQQHLGDDCIPALAGKHALTVEERQRLDDCKLMINHEFVVDGAGRAARRDDKHKRGAGRPAGALNKNK